MMGRTVLGWMLVCALAWPAPAAKHTRKKHTAARASHSAKKPSRHARRASGKGRRASRRAPRYHIQPAPSPDRYKEIQQALAAKGYFQGTADGRWGQDSVDALRRMQHDEKLDETGKLNSLSLIALGLGPKRLARQNADAGGTAAEPKP